MTPMIELADGSYVQPEHVVHIQDGGPYMDKPVGWIYIVTVAGPLGWFHGDAARLRQRINDSLDRIG